MKTSLFSRLPFRRMLTVCAGVALVMTLASCALTRPILREITVRRAIMVKPAEGGEIPLYVWQGNRVPGQLSVRVDLSDQKAYIFKDRENVGWTYVATGRSGHDTPVGTFHVQEKIVDKRSNKYGVIRDADGDVVHSNATNGVHRIPSGGRFVGAPMPYWMRLTGSGVGMHAGPIPNPGQPASHGCIRMPLAMAETLFQNVNVGTPVTITP
ncbi:MAG: L,D-transpeptidase [Verrucomicrobiales bacterium]|nr:L,D-transpeptidase [Verrucomicrobiales bacterium]MCP5557757.1 L,D-transpeptidase [Verrucomicrobiaceae bacterium]